MTYTLWLFQLYEVSGGDVSEETSDFMYRYAWNLNEEQWNRVADIYYAK